MTKLSPPSPFQATDYETIEAALLESTRGRWFLGEFSRRNRSADTHMLLDAITKLEEAVIRPRPDDKRDNLRHDLIEMAEAISQTRQEIAAIQSPNEDSQFTTATEELDAIVESTEKATSEILQAAEEVQETAWLLREKGADGEACDKLDERATNIYMACSFQDITGQRTGKVIEVLRFLENRVKSMIDIWGLEDVEVRETSIETKRPDGHLLNGPQLEGHGLEQSDIDDMINITADDDDFNGNPDLAFASIDQAFEEGAVPASAPQAPAQEVQAGQPADDLPSLDVAMEAVPASDNTPAAASFAPEVSSCEADVETAAVTGPPVAMAAPDASIAASLPGTSTLPDVVAVDAFEEPEHLQLDGLDAAKTAALFC